MLTSQLGIRLIMWAGATVPRPVPPDAMASLLRVEVTNDADAGDGFQLTFSLTKDKTLQYSLTTSGTFDLFNRVFIGVTLGVLPEVLIDGVVTNHQLSPGSGPDSATLTVTGRDVSLMMDLNEENESFPNQPDSVIASQLILKYTQYGFVPQVTFTPNVPIETDRVPRQHESDLRFIQRMAGRNGFVTYVEPVTFGVNTFYFGPRIRGGLPQRALTKDLGASTNLKSLTFANEGLAPVGTKGSVIEPILGLTLPIPSLPSLNLPPLAASPQQPQRTRVMRESANQNIADAATSAVAAVTNAPDAVQGSGVADTVRYGAILRARRPVGVRGAGFDYDGFYYVKSVKHIIMRGEYSQEFHISREGTGALLPAVIP